MQRQRDVGPTGRRVDSPRLKRADIWFLPSMVLCVPFIYVDWVGFTARHPLIGVPWAAYVLGGVVYFLVRFRKIRPSGRRKAESTGGLDNVDSGSSHKGPVARFSFRKLNALDWMSILTPTIFVACVAVILIHYA